MDDKTEEFARSRIQLEESRSECLKYQTQLRELEERFFQSDLKTKEDVGRELRVRRDHRYVKGTVGTSMNIRSSRRVSAMNMALSNVAF